MSRGGYRPFSGKFPNSGIEESRILDSDYMSPPIGDNSTYETPLQYLVDLFNDPTVNVQRRDRAAIAVLGYLHCPIRDLGKKTLAQERADNMTNIPEYLRPQKVPDIPIDVKQ